MRAEANGTRKGNVVSYGPVTDDIPFPFSCDRVLRVFPHLRRAEGENDLRLGNAALNQFRGDAAFGVVFLNPYFAVHNVNVDEGEMDALARICLLYTSPSPRDRQKSR